MGNYRSHPATEIDGEQGSGPFYTFAAASMQGWRIQQEDAHACLPQFDDEKGLAMFAVFDGHGGFEVSKYSASKLPDHIKNDLAYKHGDFKEALEEAFMSFDKSLRTPEVIKELNAILDNKPTDGTQDSEPEDVNGLLEEAYQPIEKVLLKYTKEKLGDKNVNGESSEEAGGSGSKSEEAAGSAAAAVPEGSSSAGGSSAGGSSSAAGASAGSSGPSPSRPAKGERKKLPPAETGGSSATKDSSDDSEDEEDETFDSEDADGTSDSEDSEANTEDSEDGTDEDEEDATSMFMKILKRRRQLEEGSSDSEEEGDGPPKKKRPVLTGLSTVPAIESGTTAVVALLGKEKVTVANIGDSRAILGRLKKGEDGVTKIHAVELSKDHKPELPEEKERIENAGGVVDDDGRVDGGLNLSRAFGDFVFKANEELPAEKQEVIAFPEVISENLCFGDDDQDKFLFVACDGIWNDMTSDEVANYIWTRLSCDVPLDNILEQMFKDILAPNLGGDGTGCDNMTAIIVKFGKESDAPESKPKEPTKASNGEAEEPSAPTEKMEEK